MTFRIALCDDQDSILLLVHKYLVEISNDESIDIIIDCFQNPINLLDNVKEELYDLVFLDVDMPQMNGIELGERLKSKNKNIIIIYITAYHKYAYRAYQVRAFNYLMKPINKDKLRECFMETIEFMCQNNKQKNEESITIQYKGRYIHIPYYGIIFFEKNKNKVKVVCSEGEYQYYSTFKQLKKKLIRECFIQCHQGYIINKDKILRYEKNKVILEYNYVIPVSKKNANTVRQVFAEKLRRK